MATFRQVSLLVLCVAGIYGAYLTQGIVSEHLAVKKYGPEQQRFKHLEALNGAQSLTCWLWAWAIVTFLQATGQLSAADQPSWTAYWKAGITNSIGPACGMFALKNITYSAQVLAKSCKMVPVMLAGTVLHGKTYSLLEYLCMTLIGVGVAMFARKSSSKGSSKLVSPNLTLGYTLCGVNLIFDGYTNAVQDEIHKQHPRSSSFHMMCWMNFWTSLFYSMYLFGLTSAGSEAIAFMVAHHDAAKDVALFCLCGAFGQLFIFLTIKSFGSLVNTLACTTRKFFNILLSVLLNGTELLPTQWGAVGMVFTGLLTEKRVVVCYSTEAYRDAAVHNVERSDVCLEVGCHEGVTTHILSSRCTAVIGIDITPEVVCKAQGKFPGLQFRVADGFDVPQLHSFLPPGSRYHKCLVDISGKAPLSLIVSMLQAHLADDSLFPPDTVFIVKNEALHAALSEHERRLHSSESTAAASSALDRDPIAGVPATNGHAAANDSSNNSSSSSSDAPQAAAAAAPIVQLREGEGGSPLQRTHSGSSSGGGEIGSSSGISAGVLMSQLRQAVGLVGLQQWEVFRHFHNQESMDQRHSEPRRVRKQQKKKQQQQQQQQAQQQGQARVQQLVQ
ncbi:MAG: hypothetical protein WDW38_004172 [Sanguina aurantia]